ncbi:hypothetical protein Baya_6995 [Bagarius yarrelli]|uniref:Uncharacterized protein n=1 Tax=Bagarius yarrelli TaxID=175774 RepID=A0A556U3H8_BAGYA|nr:hypothetical protein Baya_6995 [Bagarius yarrelli]
MYHLVCFILILSLKGIKTANSDPEPSDKSDNNETTTPIPTTMFKTSANPKTVQVQSTTTKTADCLLRLSNTKELLLFLIIALLSLICLLLLVIIMCLSFKRCRGFRKDKMIVMKSSRTTRRTSVNGGLSETDLMLKDCSSVKVEIETTPDVAQKPEKEERKPADEVNQVNIEKKEISANDTTETSAMTPAKENAQSSQTDPKRGNELETAE